MPQHAENNSNSIRSFIPHVNYSGKTVGVSLRRDKLEKRSRAQWKANITFVPFESKTQRDMAYRQWAKLHLNAEMRKLL